MIHGRDARATILHRFQNDRSGRISQRPVLFRSEIVKELLAILLFVERFHAAVEHDFHIRRDSTSFLVQSRNGLFDADGVPNFEWSQFPVEPPAHRAINFDNRIRDFRNAIRRVTKRARQGFPEKCADTIFGPH